VIISREDIKTVGRYQDSWKISRQLEDIKTVGRYQPFPGGNYKILYTFHDEPSGNTFEITRDIIIIARAR
jgi:hypothetical protein